MNLLLKPASHCCNLNCAYCFYKRAAEVYAGAGAIMSPATAATVMTRALALGDPGNAFCWQGGEPTLMGVAFYAKVVDCQRRLAARDQMVENTIQTNGILIDDAWAGFLRDNRFLVGLSLDGPEAIHDRYRADPAGRGTHHRVMAAAERLSRHGVPFNILTLLTDANVNQPDALYAWFRSQGFTHWQLIPCTDRDPQGRPAPHAITGDQLGRFYTRLFDLWLEDGFPHISIRLFEDLLIYILDGGRASCTWLAACDSYLLVEHNGDVYPCDFQVYPEWRLGSLITDSLTEIMASPLRLKFAAQKSRTGPECRACEYAEFCQGDCPRHRTGSQSRLCAAWKMLLRHVDTHPRDIRAMALAAREAHRKTIGRNDPCLCGSGRKYKKCCGR